MPSAEALLDVSAGIRASEPASELEATVLETIASHDGITMEDLVARLCDWTWSEVFIAIDAMSRRGAVALRRDGFQYRVTMRPTSACPRKHFLSDKF
ncbi:MAG TPA: hypothetical protein VFA38_05945 [Nitrospirales bacterium]|nr:hypothetical protein [Nitrospirales bacterium]